MAKIFLFLVFFLFSWFVAIVITPILVGLMATGIISEWVIYIVLVCLAIFMIVMTILFQDA